MPLSELIAKLQALQMQHGDLLVYYIDNGDFAENGGMATPDPQPSGYAGADLYRYIIL